MQINRLPNVEPHLLLIELESGQLAAGTSCHFSLIGADCVRERRIVYRVRLRFHLVSMFLFVAY